MYVSFLSCTPVNPFVCLRCIYNFQVLFIKWVLTVFDMIDAKDQLRAIYGFIFSFVSEENLVCVMIMFALYSQMAPKGNCTRAHTSLSPEFRFTNLICHGDF